MNVDNGSSDVGLGIDQLGCTGESNQRFTFTPTSDGYYTIQPQNDNLCLDAGSGSYTTAIQVVQNTCSGGPSQKWRVGANADGSYAISTISANGCLDVYAGRTADGTILTTYACHAASNESFVMAGFVPVTTKAVPLNGFVSTVVIQFSGSCAEAGGSWLQAGLDESNCTGAANQSFTFAPTADGFYNIEPLSSGLCLDAGLGSLISGIQVVQNACTGGGSQKWSLTATNSGYYAITTPDRSGCLDVYAGRTANGTIITTYACHSASNENFSLAGLSGGGTPPPPVSQTSAPVISPASGTYSAPLTVTIAPVVSGTPVYYTTDGSAPTTSSKLYAGPITLTVSATVNAVAVAPGSTASSVASSAFSLQTLQTAAPVISPASGNYSAPLTVTILPAITGTPVYYTTDGSTPTTSSKLYAGPLTLTLSAAVKAIAVAPNSAASSVVTNAYALQSPQTASPTISPSSGTYSFPLTVTIAPAIPGTPVFYTTDGSTPSTTSKLYSGPISLNAATTVKAVAVTANSTASAVVSSTFSAPTPQTAPPAISPASGNYTSSVTVTITPAVSGTPVYYTTDGSTPTANSKVYSGPFTLTTSEAVSAIALAGGSTASSVVTSAFAITSTPTSPLSGSSTTTIVAVFDGLCLNIEGGSSQTGLGIDQSNCAGGSNQSFILTPTSEGFYTIQPSSNTALCLDAGSGSVTTALQIVQNTCTGGTSQKWQIKSNGDGSWSIVTVNGAGCMDVYGGRTAPGTMVTTYACHSAGNESFLLAGFSSSTPTGPVTPPPTSSASGSPVIFNSSPNARPGDYIYVQGVNIDATSQVFLSNSAASSGTQLPVVNSVGSTWLSAQVPSSWSGAMLLRVSNSFGSSATVKLNGAIPFHLDALQLVPGGAFRVLGRNLLMSGYTPSVTVDGQAASVNVSASTQNMLVVTAPKGLNPTNASTIMVDNGNGTGAAKLDRTITVVAGSGDPFGLGVGWGAAFTFAGKVISVNTPCNSTGDDSGAIQSAIANAAAAGGGVVQLPSGTCVLANSLTLPSNVVLQGTGKTSTTLRYQSNYPINSQGSDLVGLRNFTLLNAGSTIEGLIWKQNTRSFFQNIKISDAFSHQLFLTANTNFVVTQTDFVQGGSVGEQNPYLFNDCAGFLFINNTSMTIDGSPTFGSIHDALITSNHFTRNAGNQDESPVVATHQFVMDFDYRTSIIGNTFDVTNGTITNTLRNDGETLLTEGGGNGRTENLGTVVTATSNTLSDPANVINVNPFGTGLPENYGVAIVSGTGAGQTREVIGYSNSTLQVDHAWDVIPDNTSRYATFVWGLEKSLIQGNTLIGNPRGIWLYQTAVRDVDVSSNTIINGGGIFLRTYQSQSQKQFDPMYNVRITNNSVSNNTNLWLSYIDVVFVNKDPLNFGTADTGIEIRGNTLVPNSPNLTSATEDYASQEGFMNVMRSESSGGQLTGVPMLLGTIFQSNQCAACNTAFVIGTGDYGTVLVGNTPAAGSPNFLSDWQTLGSAAGGSIGTVIK